MKFGDWSITAENIEWAGEGFNRFVIEKAHLLETFQVEDVDDYLYKWIVVATGEDWLTEDALYDLNFAFVFVAGGMDGQFSYKIFDKTLDYQFNSLDEEEEDQP